MAVAQAMQPAEKSPGKKEVVYVDRVAACSMAMVWHRDGGATPSSL
ncbi:hypothetical protein KCP75_01565 [Salmonella enterica subsp. enterica]|nr:hypothetical protein KCP75_01565 [Salmonella enterica subsp. enterica]